MPSMLATNSSQGEEETANSPQISESMNSPKQTISAFKKTGHLKMASFGKSNFQAAWLQLGLVIFSCFISRLSAESNHKHITNSKYNKKHKKHKDSIFIIITTFYLSLGSS